MERESALPPLYILPFSLLSTGIRARETEGSQRREGKVLVTQVSAVSLFSSVISEIPDSQRPGVPEGPFAGDLEYFRWSATQHVPVSVAREETLVWDLPRIALPTFLVTVWAVLSASSSDPHPTNSLYLCGLSNSQGLPGSSRMPYANRVLG